MAAGFLAVYMCSRAIAHVAVGRAVGIRFRAYRGVRGPTTRRYALPGHEGAAHVDRADRQELEALGKPGGPGGDVPGARGKELRNAIVGWSLVNAILAGLRAHADGGFPGSCSSRSLGAGRRELSPSGTSVLY